MASDFGVTPSNGQLTSAGSANINSLITASATAGTAATKMTFTVDGKDIAIDFNTVTGGAVKGLAATSKGDEMTTTATALQSDLNQAIKDYNATVPTDKQVSNISVSVKDGAFVIQSGSTAATSSIKFDTSDAAKALGIAGTSSATQGGGVDFQIGANAGQTMKITVGDMRTAALGIDKIDMTTKEGAQAATTLLDTALKAVSGQRADLGAFSNRLEHTINKSDRSHVVL